MYIVISCSILAIILTYLESKGKIPGGMMCGFILMTTLCAIHYDYGNDYMQSYQNYQKFMEYLRYLETYKEEFKGKIPYFWGMRKNWFPLILLGAVKEGNQEALNLFNKMVKDRIENANTNRH